MNHSRRQFLIRLSAVGSLAAVSGGCQYLGLGAYAAPDPTVGAKYKGLQNQRVAVMVWCDRATAIDWPTLQLDLTRGVISRLEASEKKDKPKDLTGTKFVVAESVIRYQRDHPEIDTEAITDVAPRLDVTRLIYVELQQFSTRPEDSIELFRGSLTGNLKVVAVKPTGAKIVFEEDAIHVDYPKDSPEQGLPDKSDGDIYEKTLQAFSIQIVNRFIPHIEPRVMDE